MLKGLLKLDRLKMNPSKNTGISAIFFLVLMTMFSAQRSADAFQARFLSPTQPGQQGRLMPLHFQLDDVFDSIKKAQKAFDDEVWDLFQGAKEVRKEKRRVAPTDC